MKGKETIRYNKYLGRAYLRLFKLFNIKLYGQYIDETATIHWSKEGKRLTHQEFKELKLKIRSLGYETNKELRNFDGDTKLLIDCLEKSMVVKEKYPDLFESKHKIYIKSTEPNPFFENDAFAETNEYSITINDYAFRSREILEKEYKIATDERWFVKGTNYYSVIIHELGHIVANKYHINGLDIAMKITNKSEVETLYYLKNHLSIYAGSDLSGDEIISEVFSDFFNNSIPSVFSLQFIKEIDKIILKKG